MYACEAIALADQNGRTYVSKYGTYNKDKGFVINPKYIKFQTTLDSRKILMSYQELINGLLHENCWSLKVEKPKPRKMTKADIEKELGYEIEIEIGSEDVKPTNTKCKHRLYDADLERMAYETDELIRQCFLRR